MRKEHTGRLLSEDQCRLLPLHRGGGSVSVPLHQGNGYGPRGSGKQFEIGRPM